MFLDDFRRTDGLHPRPSAFAPGRCADMVVVDGDLLKYNIETRKIDLIFDSAKRCEPKAREAATGIAP